MRAHRRWVTCPICIRDYVADNPVDVLRYGPCDDCARQRVSADSKLPHMREAKSVARTGGEQLPWVATAVDSDGTEHTAQAPTYERAVDMLHELIYGPAKEALSVASADKPNLAAGVDVGAINSDHVGAHVAPSAPAHDKVGAAIARAGVITRNNKHRNG